MIIILIEYYLVHKNFLINFIIIWKLLSIEFIKEVYYNSYIFIFIESNFNKLIINFHDKESILYII